MRRSTACLPLRIRYGEGRIETRVEGSNRRQALPLLNTATSGTRSKAIGVSVSGISLGRGGSIRVSLNNLGLGSIRKRVLAYGSVSSFGAFRRPRIIGATPFGGTGVSGNGLAMGVPTVDVIGLGLGWSMSSNYQGGERAPKSRQLKHFDIYLGRIVVRILFVLLRRFQLFPLQRRRRRLLLRLRP